MIFSSVVESFEYFQINWLLLILCFLLHAVPFSIGPVPLYLFYTMKMLSETGKYLIGMIRVVSVATLLPTANYWQGNICMSCDYKGSALHIHTDISHLYQHMFQTTYSPSKLCVQCIFGTLWPIMCCCIVKKNRHQIINNNYAVHYRIT